MSFRSLLVILCGGLVLAAVVAFFSQSILVGGFVLAAFVAGAVVMGLSLGRGRAMGAMSDERVGGRSVASPASPTLPRAVSASALLDAMMDGMREGVIVVDNQMRITAANRAAREIFDLPTEASGALGTTRWATRRLSELTRNPSLYAAFRAALEEGELREVKVETRDVVRRVFDLRVAPLSSVSVTAPQGAIGVFFDITRLERLERVRQEFLSNVSHELRTPLTAILTFIETLEAGAVDDAENNRRFLEIIRRNAARMHNLIDDILELSAIEAGTVAVEPARVRLHNLVGDVLTTIAARARSRDIELYNETRADAFVFADARRLEQMLTNLIDNAIKFNREGGTVTVSHERSDERDRITVSDTGEGIAPEHAERIFERFYRVDRARSRALGGTGLGLAIVKHLARTHGGEATVTSTPGQGSIFTIELPSAHPTDETADTSVEELPFAGSAGIPARRARKGANDLMS